VGWYCLGDGTARSCPGGTYGAEEGLTSVNCSGTCLGGFYCPPGSTSPTEYPCTYMQSDEYQAMHYCPRGSHAPLPTRQGFYVSYAQDPKFKEAGYFGDVATIAISFNVTTASAPTSDRRALLKANIANKLLTIDEGHISRFGVIPLPTGLGWAVRFEATHSVSQAGYETALKWKDGVKALLKSKPFLLNEDGFNSNSSPLVNLRVEPESVRGVVAGRRTMVIHTHIPLFEFIIDVHSFIHSPPPPLSPLQTLMLFFVCMHIYIHTHIHYFSYGIKSVATWMNLFSPMSLRSGTLLSPCYYSLTSLLLYPNLMIITAYYLPPSLRL
jgi:hypothetical protein